ncbi:hypothetical protein NL108_018545 [Boleophthalmus pectinirostris]|nr:hypothetical protein NL108_018545 [Boleophthalmus pectinirostris]
MRASGGVRKGTVEHRNYAKQKKEKEKWSSSSGGGGGGGLERHGDDLALPVSLSLTPHTFITWASGRLCKTRERESERGEKVQFKDALWNFPPPRKFRSVAFNLYFFACV